MHIGDFPGKHPNWSVRLLMLSVLFCTGCSMNLRPDPLTQESGIAGRWQLVTPERESLASQLRTVLEQANAKQEQRNRRYASRTPPEILQPDAADDKPAPDGAAGQSAHADAVRSPGFRRSKWEIREQREQEEALLNAVLPSRQLQITQSASGIELIPDLGARRHFDRGIDSTLVSNYATLRIESGWQNNEFVVHSRDVEQGLEIVERYQRQGYDHLHMQVQLSLKDAKNQIFSAEYRLVAP